MNQLETYHKLCGVIVALIHLRDSNTDNPGVALAYDNACIMIDDIADTLYQTGIEQDEKA